HDALPIFPGPQCMARMVCIILWSERRVYPRCHSGGARSVRWAADDVLRPGVAERSYRDRQHPGRYLDRTRDPVPICGVCLPRTRAVQAAHHLGLGFGLGLLAIYVLDGVLLHAQWKMAQHMDVAVPFDKRGERMPTHSKKIVGGACRSQPRDAATNAGTVSASRSLRQD